MPDRGPLRIFFGYCAGVGRSRAMRHAAEPVRAAGRRVLTVTGDLDLDAVLAEAPDLVLLPDLARTNPPGTRHRRRYQDVMELRAAGIEVWTTLEVGNLESLVDPVERILGFPKSNTVPDAAFDAADEVELVDLPPEDLIERFRSVPGAARASGFPDGRDGTERAALVTLRELMLRRAADRLSAREHAKESAETPPGGTVPASERLLVCVGPSPSSARLIRATSRMAASLHARWTAVHVGVVGPGLEEADRRLSDHLQLAESLGAEPVILAGADVAQEVVSYAQAHGVTRIVIGKTRERRRRIPLRRTLVDRVIARSGDIDVHVIRDSREDRPAGRREGRVPSIRPSEYLGGAAVMALATGIAALFDRLGLSEANLVLAYLLGVTAVAARYGRGPAVVAAFLAVLAFNFFFTAPRLTFEVHDSQYLFTFGVMLGIGLLVSTLMARIREQSLATRRREERTEQLYQLTRELSATSGRHQIAAAAGSRLRLLLEEDVAILAPDEHDRLRPIGPATPALADDPSLDPVAAWVHRHRTAAGAGTETLGDAAVLCLPLLVPGEAVGVMAIRPRDPRRLLLPDRRRLAETCAGQVALALQRDRLTEQVHRAIARAEAETLRSAVLSSVSHDFRSPLAAITGAASSLLESGDRLDAEVRRDLLLSVHEEADRLSRLVENLLQMTRLESGHLVPQREWNILEDLVGSALTRVARQLAGRPVSVDIPSGLPMVRVDGVLIELVLINLLDNAAKYSPPGTPVRISAAVEGGDVLIEVADRGAGLGEEEKRRVFEKFYRGPRQAGGGPPGAGLGLAICAAVMQLHGGRVIARDVAGGGTGFVVALPAEDQPPAIDVLDGRPPGEESST